MKWIKQQPVSGLLKLAIYGRRDLIPNSVNPHIHASFLRQSFETLWDKEYESIHRTCCSKFRTKDVVTSYCVRDWQIFSGNFYPKKPIGRNFHTASMSCSNGALEYLNRQKGKVICLNDSEDDQEFVRHKQQIIEAFEKLLPEKSAFEL